MSIKTTIKVRFTVVGFHCWPQAPPSRAYLAQRHRHLFHFQVEQVVNGLDREVEFHNLLYRAKEALTELWQPDFFSFEFDTYSCEQIALKLKGYLVSVSAVEVWEDNECGARVERLEE